MRVKKAATGTNTETHAHAEKASVYPTRLRRIATWCASITLSIILSIVTGIVFILFTVSVAGYNYELSHPQIIGEDDLGLGLVAMLWVLIAFALAIPIMILLSGVFARKIHKLLNRS